MTLRSEEILLAVFLKPNSRRSEEKLLVVVDEEETAASLLVSFNKAQSPSIKSVNLVLSV